MTNDTRAALQNQIVSLAATGNKLSFERDGLIYFAKSGATTTACTCLAASAYPPGLSFTLDNSNGSGSLTLVPATGSTITVTTGKVFHVTVAASGVFKSSDLAS